MFDKFLRNFQSDSEAPRIGRHSMPSLSSDLSPELCTLLESLGGQSFANGLYRIFTCEESARWTANATQAFPLLESRIYCFGYDWLGRIFALEKKQAHDGQPLVQLLDIGFNEALEIPCNLEAFHNEELVEYSEEALAGSFYAQWLKSGGAPPRPKECIGYKVPPTLGGADSTDNLELSDMEVYWELIGQINRKVSTSAT